jgi:hypothetical protein
MYNLVVCPGHCNLSPINKTLAAGQEVNEETNSSCIESYVAVSVQHLNSLVLALGCSFLAYFPK